MAKKAGVTPHLFGRVHFCCDILSCLVLHDAVKEIHLIPCRPPPASCVHFPLIAGANGKFIIISSLEVQIQTYTNIEKSRFLLTPNLRMLDFFWHLPPTTPPESQFSHSLRPPAQRSFLVHALRSHTEEVPQHPDVAENGRLVDVGVASGCGSGFHQRVASGRLQKLRGEKSVKKNDVQKTTKN